MSNVYIKPNTGPEGQPLMVRMENKPHEYMPDEGALVELTPHWVRRLNDGSVIEATAPKAPKSKE